MHDDHDGGEIPFDAWECDVIVTAIRKLVSNAQVQGRVLGPATERAFRQVLSELMLTLVVDEALEAQWSELPATLHAMRRAARQSPLTGRPAFRSAP